MSNFVDKAFAGELPRLGYMSRDQLQEYILRTDTTRSERYNVNFATTIFYALARRHNVETVPAREVQPDIDRSAPLDSAEHLVDMDDVRGLQERGELTAPPLRTPMSNIGPIGERILAGYIEERILLIDGPQG